MPSELILIWGYVAAGSVSELALGCDNTDDFRELRPVKEVLVTRRIDIGDESLVVLLSGDELLPNTNKCASRSPT